MEQRLLEWIGAYGPGAIFCALMLGIFGLPIPDELLMTLAGALAREGKLALVPTLIASIAGCTCGITLSYVLGRTVGMKALRRWLHVSDAALTRTHDWFHRSGGLLLTFGYYIPAVRHCTAIAAGSAPLEYKTFAAFAYTGAVIWCLSFITLGYYAGSHWRAALDKAEHVGPILLVPIAIVALVVYFVRRRRTA